MSDLEIKFHKELGEAYQREQETLEEQKRTLADVERCPRPLHAGIKL